MTSIGFDGILDFVRDNRTQAIDDLTRYFTNYTGRWFEYFSERSNPLHIDANDIAACGALSVELKGKVIDGLIARADEIDARLAGCPPVDARLWTVDPDSDQYAAISDLYGFVRRIDGMGPVNTSKLLACKRPHFVPIRDTVVESLLGAGDLWWAPWHEALSDPKLVDLVEDITPSNVPANASILRRLDIILWMHGKRG